MPANKSNNSSSADNPTSDRGSAITVTGRKAWVEQLLDAVSTARRDICLLSFNLDPRLYNHDDVAEKMKTFLLQSPRQRLRILLHDTSICARGHRLVDLGRQLSSFVEFRVLADQHRDIRSDWLIIDEQQVLERRTPDSLDARRSQNPQAARARRKQFDDYWHAGEAASALRSLHWG